jgi:hypothetical protein
VGGVHNLRQTVAFAKKFDFTNLAICFFASNALYDVVNNETAT